MASGTGALGGAASGAATGTAIMPGWGTAIGGIVGGVAGLFGAGDDSGEKAADAIREAQLRMEARLDSSALEVEGVVDTYYDRLDQIERDFDPYDMSQSFASFYEGVIQPMEIDFEENLLPSIRSAYQGGLAGGGAGLSGASKEAELKAKQRLSTEKGKLMAGERDKTIDRNIQLRGIEEGTAADRLSAGTLAPSMRAGAAAPLFGAEQAAIETRYAADRSKFESILAIPSAIISGAEAGSTISDRLGNLRKKEGEV